MLALFVLLAAVLGVPFIRRRPFRLVNVASGRVRCDRLVGRCIRRSVARTSARLTNKSRGSTVRAAIIAQAEYRLGFPAPTVLLSKP